MSERTRPSTETIRRGRLTKAVEFLDGAILIDDDMPDAAVFLWSTPASRPPTSIRCAPWPYAAGENHNEAVALLAKADAGVEKHLRALLNVKSKVSYTHQSATADERKRSRRAAETLVEAARRAAAS
jgi:hypothetical protein